MFCDKGFQAYGKIGLSGASIGGQLIFRGAHLDGKGEPALIADGLKVADAMFCDEGFRACEEVRLVGALIRRPLHLDGAYLDGIDGPALTADGLSATDIFCRDRFQAHGNIHLHSANIRGALDLRRAHLDGRAGLPLPPTGSWSPAIYSATRDSRPTGRFACTAPESEPAQLRSAHLDGKGFPALTADLLTVVGNLYCNEEFQADGPVNLSGASVGGQLILSGAHLDGKDGLAFAAEGSPSLVRCSATMGSRPTDRSTYRREYGKLVDEAESWPHVLILDGLTYDGLTNMPVRQRLDWLSRLSAIRRSHISSSPPITGGWATTGRPAASC